MSEALTIGVDARALVPAATGIGVYCRSVLAGLAGAGFDPVALAHAPIGGLDDVDGVGRAVSPFPSGVAWQQLRLNRELTRNGCDLLWSPVFTLPWTPRLPAVITVHDMTAWLFPQAHRFKVVASLKPFLGRSVRFAARIITPSAHTAADLAHRFPAAKGKTTVIPHGVDPEFVPADADEVEATRRRLGCAEGYLVYAGTIEPRKNLGALLDAWQSLREEDQTPPLVVIGGIGWKAQRTLERMRKLESLGLRYLGRSSRSEQVAVVQAATAMVFPSLYEGFGLPPLEAMACAVPVISSNRSSLPEVVGNAGLLIDPEDRGEMMQAIRTVISDPAFARELARRGYDRSRRFTWSASVAAHAEVFHQALTYSR